MLRSTERILTMHAGTTPRVPELRQMVLDKSAGENVDQAELTARLRKAIAETVRRQVEIGLDSINDGELGKSSFTNYARERLTGHAHRLAQPGNVLARIYGRDAADFPDYFEGRGNLGGYEVVCVGPLAYTGQEAVAEDIANFKAALGGRRRAEHVLRPWRRGR